MINTNPKTPIARASTALYHRACVLTASSISATKTSCRNNGGRSQGVRITINIALLQSDIYSETDIIIHTLVNPYKYIYDLYIIGNSRKKYACIFIVQHISKIDIKCIM